MCYMLRLILQRTLYSSAPYTPVRLVVQKIWVLFPDLKRIWTLKFVHEQVLEADSESKSSESERIRSQIFWTLPIFDLQQLVASIFARNGENS